MRAWSSARFTVPLPDGHRFPIAKYQRIRDTVVARGILAPAEVEEPDRVERWALGLVHTPAYVESIIDGTLAPQDVRRLGFPWSDQLRERSLRTVQGTVDAGFDALTHGAGINLAGGTHHAFAGHGEGFCVFNDVAVAVRVLQREGRVRRVAIIDLDVHQGNGTASIFAGDPDVFTFSMHGAKNFPFRKERSTLDVELDDLTRDPAYCSLLTPHLDRVLDEASPDIAFYLAGADPYVDDRFGRLALSFEGLRARDRLVFAQCRRRSIPVVVTLAGGYARSLEDVVSIHATTVHELRRAYG
ncbi:MAG TPA: histone deacetylase [Gemmatimonadales bacterium]|jgi:acetoin utilization deacetylase AcuC-like enzyme|nr:histone deacetylase [Gemmatimonadales bacterium]